MMKRAFWAIWNFGRELFADGRIFDRAMILFAGLGLAAQLAILSGYLYQSAEPRGIVGATDNDGGVAVAVAVDTQLWNDNGWRPYGPVYYRLVRIARTLAVDPAPTPDAAARAVVTEKAHHFLLMVVSGLAVMFLSFLIVSLLTFDPAYRLLGTISLTGAFLGDSTWTEMVFRAHPDHVFAAAMAVAAWRTWLWLREPGSRRELLLMGAAWGLASATKLTTLLFAPALVLLMFPARREVLIARFQLFVASIAFVYLLVGFPQSFNFGGVIEFLIQQQRNVHMGDFATLSHWLGLFGAQIWRPLAVLVGLSLLVPLRRDERVLDQWALPKLAALVLLPTLYLWSRKIAPAPDYWYPLPFIAVAIVAASVLLARFMPRFGLWERVRMSRWVKVAAFFAVPWLAPALPSEVPRRLALEQVCRPEARTVETLVDAEASRGHHILADPYIPYARVFHDKEIEMAWEMHPERIVPGKTTMIALRSDYYRTYLPVEEGGTGALILHIHDMEKTRAFYRLFNGKTETVDPFGQTWRKTHSDACGYEIWERR